MSRRTFLKTGTAAAAALSMAPTDVLAKKAKAAPKGMTGKLKILAVGVGGRGHAVINGCCKNGERSFSLLLIRPWRPICWTQPKGKLHLLPFVCAI